MLKKKSLCVLTSSSLTSAQEKLIGTGFKRKIDLHQLFQNTVTLPEHICKSKVSKVKLKLPKMQRQYSILLNPQLICMEMFHYICGT